MRLNRDSIYNTITSGIRNWGDALLHNENGVSTLLNSHVIKIPVLDRDNLKVTTVQEELDPVNSPLAHTTPGKLYDGAVYYMPWKNGPYQNFRAVDAEIKQFGVVTAQHGVSLKIFSDQPFAGNPEAENQIRKSASSIFKNVEQHLEDIRTHNEKIIEEDLKPSLEAAFAEEIQRRRDNEDLSNRLKF